MDFSNLTGVLGKLIPPMPGPFGIGTWGDGRPDSSPGDLSALVKAYGAAKSASAQPQGPDALFGPATLPQTAAPLPAGLIPPQAAPAQASAAPSPLPPPTTVGPGTIGQPTAPQVSDGGYNAIDAAANSPAGPTSVGGAPLAGYSGVTPQAAPAPYGLGNRIRNASASLSDSGSTMPFFQRNTALQRDPITGDFLDPQAASKAQEASGPDLIQKFMTYLHSK